MEEIGNIRNLISGELLKAYGQEISYPKDCQYLSDSILQNTKRRISVSTLKRLFGIIKSPYNPSKYTLDTIALYLNYQNWSELKKSSKADQINPPEINYWLKLKSRIEVVTNHSLSTIKEKLEDQLKDFKPREFAIRKFETFLNSSYTATALIAPGGYGKTTMITQLTEIFFTGENARYPGDIVCLIDGSMLVNIMNLNLEIVRLKNIVDFQERNSFSNYFRQYPEEVKGRFVLIIDSLYQIYYQEEKLNSFVENLMDILFYYKNTSWFKCLITCRPDNWKLLLNHIQTRPDLENIWCDVNFHGSSADYVNVPLLNKEEINYFLRKKHDCTSYEKLKFLYPDITELLNIPYMLNLFCALESPKIIHCELGILEYFYSQVILIEPYLEEKYAILYAFVQHSEYARKTNSVNKTDLPCTGTYKNAYKALIFNNILNEYSLPGKYLSIQTYVRFANDIQLGFFLANAWIKEKNFNLDLIKRVFAFYEDNPSLRTRVLKHLIKIAFREKNIELLSKILPVFLSETSTLSSYEIDKHLLEIIQTIGVELRKNSMIRDILIPVYARNEIGRKFYFESFFDMDSLVLHSGNCMDHYLEHAKTDEAKIYGYFTKFMQYFLSEERKKCKEIFALIKSFKFKQPLSQATNAYYYAIQIIYQSCYEERIEHSLLDRIYRTSDMILKERTSSGSGIPVFEYMIIFALNYGNNFAEIVEFFERMQKSCELSKTSNSWQYHLCKSMYARALLFSGEALQAKKIYRIEDLTPVPINYKYYVTIRFYLIRIDFLLLEERFAEVKGIIEQIKTISLMLKFKYFYNKALNFEQILSNADY